MLSVEAAHDVAIELVVVTPAANAVGPEGAVTSGQAAVDAVTVARAEMFPAASKACTPRTWLVPPPRPGNGNDVVVVAPALTPSRNRVYPVTPTLSVDAAHDRPIDVAVLVVESPVGAEGGTVSPQAAVVSVSDVRVELLLAASKVWTPSR